MTLPLQHTSHLYLCPCECSERCNATERTKGESVVPSSHHSFAAAPLSFVIRVTDFCCSFGEMADLTVFILRRDVSKEKKRDREEVSTFILYTVYVRVQ